MNISSPENESNLIPNCFKLSVSDKIEEINGQHFRTDTIVTRSITRILVPLVTANNTGYDGKQDNIAICLSDGTKYIIPPGVAEKEIIHRLMNYTQK